MIVIGALIIYRVISRASLIMTNNLTEQIHKKIQETGPITIAEFMAICLLDPTNGYYPTRDPFGERWGLHNFTRNKSNVWRTNRICGVCKHGMTWDRP